MKPSRTSKEPFKCDEVHHFSCEGTISVAKVIELARDLFNIPADIQIQHPTTADGPLGTISVKWTEYPEAGGRD